MKVCGQTMFSCVIYYVWNPNVTSEFMYACESILHLVWNQYYILKRFLGFCISIEEVCCSVSKTFLRGIYFVTGYLFLMFIVCKKDLYSKHFGLYLFVMFKWPIIMFVGSIIFLVKLHLYTIKTDRRCGPLFLLANMMLVITMLVSAIYSINVSCVTRHRCLLVLFAHHIICVCMLCRFSTNNNNIYVYAYCYQCII